MYNVVSLLSVAKTGDTMNEVNTFKFWRKFSFLKSSSLCQRILQKHPQARGGAMDYQIEQLQAQ